MATDLEDAIAQARNAVRSMTDFRPDRASIERLIWCAEGRAKQEAELLAALEGERRARAKERAALRDRFALAAREAGAKAERERQHVDLRDARAEGRMTEVEQTTLDLTRAVALAVVRRFGPVEVTTDLMDEAITLLTQLSVRWSVDRTSLVLSISETETKVGEQPADDRRRK